MTLLPQTATGRITLTIALSLLVHVVVLFVPMIELPKSEVPLPPLTAKLEPLPRVAAKPTPPPPKKKPQPKALPSTLASKDPDTTDTPTQEEELQIDPEPQPPLESQSTEIEKVTQPPHPLPKHAQLTFAAYMGKSLKVGEARHRLDIGDEQNYTLEVRTSTTGLASMFKTFEAIQKSSGMLGADGLRPDEYSESKNTSNGREGTEARFIWEEGLLRFSSGSQVTLPERAQDMVSFLYQLSQLPLDAGVVQIYISNGKKLERYELEVGAEEFIQTDFGRLRALPLHKIHAQGEEGLDVWLGLEYRLLPIKIRQIDREGHTAGEMLVSDIRVSDE